MLPNRVSNPGPLTYESGALPIALRNDDRSAALEWSVQSKKCNDRELIHQISYPPKNKRERSTWKK